MYYSDKGGDNELKSEKVWTPHLRHILEDKYQLDKEDSVRGSKKHSGS